MGAAAVKMAYTDIRQRRDLLSAVGIMRLCNQVFAPFGIESDREVSVVCWGCYKAHWSSSAVDKCLWLRFVGYDWLL